MKDSIWSKIPTHKISGEIVRPVGKQMALDELSVSASCRILRFLDAHSLSSFLRTCKGSAIGNTSVLPKGINIFSLILPVVKARVIAELQLSSSPAWLLGPDPWKSLEKAVGLDPSLADSRREEDDILSSVHRIPRVLDQFPGVHLILMPLCRCGLSNWIEALDELESWEHLRAASTRAGSLPLASDSALWLACGQLRTKEDYMFQTFPFLSL
jgi:hypothetical protein